MAVSPMPAGAMSWSRDPCRHFRDCHGADQVPIDSSIALLRTAQLSRSLSAERPALHQWLSASEPVLTHGRLYNSMSSVNFSEQVPAYSTVATC